VDSAWKQKVFAFQFGLPDPVYDRGAGWLSDFELHWLMGFLLHDHRPFRYLVAVGDIPEGVQEA